MEIKLRFLGAAQNVTGSRFLLEANGLRILIDCGLYQERQFRTRNWDPFPVPPESIDAVLLTHAHLDHCGLLPKLTRDGFSGPIYSTAATAELARIVLLDSAHLQEEDAAFKRKRHAKEGRAAPYPELPLYTAADVEKCRPLFSPVDYEQPVELGNGLLAAFHNAGHILGSSIIKLTVSAAGRKTVILFSGDVGRPHRPIVCDPAVFENADYILIESTYGDRLHNNKQKEDIKTKIARIINSTNKTGGNVVIPSFALERSQEVLYYINELLIDRQIPPLQVFLDSPMAASVTEVFQKHPELFDEMMNQQLRRRSPFSFPGLKFVATSEESKAINTLKGPVIVIAGSGMCTGGRIKHHLVNNITHPESTIMFVGFQAVGTLGRQIVDGHSPVRILGREYPIRARVVRVNGFSAHADKEELLKWLSEFKTPPKKLFVVHGEPESAAAFADFVTQNIGWNTAVPAYQDEVILN